MLTAGFLIDPPRQGLKLILLFAVYLAIYTEPHVIKSCQPSLIVFKNVAKNHTYITQLSPALHTDYSNNIRVCYAHVTALPCPGLSTLIILLPLTCPLSQLHSTLLPDWSSPSRRATLSTY